MAELGLLSPRLLLSDGAAPANDGGFRLGFARTVCSCANCSAFCRHVPGSLGPGDLEGLCPLDRDVFAWAEEHLRARVDSDVPILVPARQLNGHCHWLYEGRCLVHQHAPFGCAFFDAHMDKAEVDRRTAAILKARRDDAAANGLFYRVWQHLRSKGLIARPGDRAAMRRDLEDQQRQA